MGDIDGFVAQSEAEGIPCPVHPPVWQRLQKSTVTCSNKLALASLHQSPTLYGVATDVTKIEYLRWSYNDLNFAINTLAGNLQKLGVKRDQPVATFLYNGAEFNMAFWAAHKLGCPFVPLNPPTFLPKKSVTWLDMSASYISYDDHKSFIARLQLAHEKEFENKLQEEEDHLFQDYKKKLYQELDKQRLTHKQNTQQLQNRLDKAIALNHATKTTSTCSFSAVTDIDTPPTSSPAKPPATKISMSAIACIETTPTKRPYAPPTSPSTPSPT